jgi:PIN domain nuclease of toxin-antitoxin system
VPGIGHFAEPPHGKVGRILRVSGQTRQNLALDPFDRILVAQATFEGIVLLTMDAVVAQYPGPVRYVG